VIVNERQLAQARTQAQRFRVALEAMEAGSLDNTDLHPALKTAQIDAVRGELQGLEAEIRAYERLRAGDVKRFDVDSLGELPMTLIHARIAAGLTQRQLAERLGLKEQQIQRYEATRYDGASFSRLVDVADAIGLKIRKHVELLEPAAPTAILQRLKAIGLDEAFIRRRIAPDFDLQADSLPQMAERIGGVFGWSTDAIMGAGALDTAQLGGATARFKMPKGRDGRSAAIYTAYAHHLAVVCAEAMADRPREPIPTEWRTFRERLLTKYGAVEFRSALSLAWDFGVVVLPLNDSGAFHGACWRVGGVNVVVLKQAHRYPARWLFDLIHELRHAAEHPEASEFEVVEGAETSDERRESREERLCSWFAGQVTLSGEAEELVKTAITRVGGDLRRLKGAVEKVAADRDVDVACLANYTAFRLSLQGENWWATAAGLQDTSFDPLAYARDVFFERFAFEGLGDTDLNLLTLALHDEDADG
jgi:transcriptional regulator with XRE-family HTH domain